MTSTVGSPEELVIIGLLASGGDDDALVLGLGTPEEIIQRTGQEPLPEAGVIASAIAAQGKPKGPLIVLGGGASEAIEAILNEAEITRARLLIVGTGARDDRAALEALPWLSWTRVRHVDLEYLTPRVPDGPVRGLVGGLGLVVLDIDEADWAERTPHFIPTAQLLPRLDSLWLPVRTSSEDHEAVRRAESQLASITASASWRITAPLRTLKAALQRRR